MLTYELERNACNCQLQDSLFPWQKLPSTGMTSDIWTSNLCRQWFRASQVVAFVLKNLPASAGNIRDVGSIPGWGRSPGGGHGIPLAPVFFLENPMDREVSLQGCKELEVT